MRALLSHWRLTILLVGGVVALALGLNAAVNQAVDEAVDQAVPAAVKTAVPVSVAASSATLRRELDRRDRETRTDSYAGCIANVIFKERVAVHIDHTAQARGGTGIPRDEHYADLYRQDAAGILATRPPLPAGARDSPQTRCAARWLLTPKPRTP